MEFFFSTLTLSAIKITRRGGEDAEWDREREGKWNTNCFRYCYLIEITLFPPPLSLSPFSISLSNGFQAIIYRHIVACRENKIQNQNLFCWLLCRISFF